MKKHILLFTMLVLVSLMAKAQEINVSSTSLTEFYYLVGEGPSSEDSFVVSGSAPIDSLPWSITITACEKFEISTVPNGHYHESIVLPANGEGNVEPTTIYVRMVKNLVPGTHNGVIQLTANNALTAIVECEGQVSYQITLIAAPEQGGTVNGAGTYQLSEDITVSAVPNENYAFAHWIEGEEIVSDEAEYTFMGRTSRVLVAHFTLTALPVVGDITAPDPICAGDTLLLTAPRVTLADMEGWQMSPDTTFEVFSTYTGQILDATYDGWWLRYTASNEAGTSYSNIVPITVYSTVEEDDVVAIEGKKCGNKIEHVLIYPRAGYHYQWYLDDVALADTTQYIHNENGLKSGVYRVEISFSKSPDRTLRCPASSTEYTVRWSGKSIYPNPSLAHSTIYIENSGAEEAVLTVISTEGKSVFRQVLKTGHNALNASLPSGIYVFSIADSQSVRTEKVIIH